MIHRSCRPYGSHGSMNDDKINILMVDDLTDKLAARAVAEEATRRSQFLAEASRALVRSLDFQATLQSAGRLVVPFLGDLSAVSLSEELAGADKVLLTGMDIEDGKCWQTLVARAE